MGKKLFFLSLIILSVAMGIHWQKNRPKTKPSKARARVALNIQDLQIQDKQSGDANKDGDQGDPDSPDQDDENAEKDKPEDADNPENLEKPEDQTEANATTEENVDTAASSSDNPLMADTLIAALHNMKRNPFEHSPYAQLVQELQKKEEILARPGEMKSVKLLRANFSATIQTRKELVAVIDSRLYRKGDFFQDKKISEIDSKIVALESGTGTYLIPKYGVDVQIAEDGTYTVVDNFLKN